MITIDLNNTYQLTANIINPKISTAEFLAPQLTGCDVLMRLTIIPYPDPYLPRVYNLSMGPPIGRDKVDDRVRLKHRDSSCVFSTAILFALSFLTDYPDSLIGLDGSDDLRAILYHSMFVSNRTTMNKFFTSIGVDWYVKLLQNRSDVERDQLGQALFKPKTESFDYQRDRSELYTYYLLSLKN
ncbi:hypothetical protein MKQ68_11205 [Chitinophaga horti]|uniref:Uncharacterized protein n=1 Tax=Chitinophaga horti TaxID=2920382 RepID=A0ABY6J7L4_9BACT|nr:hypothetical protein [Chitinophaga horti]UYQ95670.1 hypothetical protein MKQ68_11205 [Chitinophaga horti]